MNHNINLPLILASGSPRRSALLSQVGIPFEVQVSGIDESDAAFDDPVQARKDFIGRQPLGRLGTAEEIAAMAVYLAADESAYTTGATMVVDGGITA